MQDGLQAFSLVMSLAGVVLVIALTYFGTKWLAKRMTGGVPPGGGHFVKILDRAVIAPNVSVVVLKAGESYYLLGVSEKNIQLITALDGFCPDETRPRQPEMKFANILTDIIKGKKNKPDYSGDDSQR